MKFHRLELEAFGVFRDKQEVNFDKLNDASLFLIRGNNGAGKTTILDAICFALYGEVPGLRGDSRNKKVDGEQTSSLKSDYADDTVAPYVTLEFTVAGTRYRVRRQPSWFKPGKKTKENAKALLHKYSKGSWGDPLASGLADVNMALFGWKETRLPKVKREPGILGLDIDQFSMIVMLPQGKFSEFLRASSDVRATLLGAIFPVKEYEAITAELSAKKQELFQAMAEARADIEASFNQLLGAIGVEEISHGVDLDRWFEALNDETTKALQSAKAALVTDASASSELQKAFQNATAALANQEKVQENLDKKTAAEADIAKYKGTLADSELAGVDPTKSKSRLPLQKRVDELQKRLDSLQLLADALAALEGTVEKLEANKVEISRLEKTLTEKGVRKKELSDVLSNERDLRNQLQASSEKLTNLEKLATHLANVVASRKQIAAARRDIPKANAELSKAKLALDKLRSEFTASASARLAASLSDGTECPVCGSTSHPKIARFSGHIPEEVELETAQKTVDDAAEEFKRVETNVTQQETVEKLLLGQLQSEYSLAGENEAKELIKAVPKLAKENLTLKAGVAAVDEAANELEELTPEIEKFENELASLKQEKSSLEGEISVREDNLKILKVSKGDLAEQEALAQELAVAIEKLRTFDEVAEKWVQAQGLLTEAQAALKSLGTENTSHDAEELENFEQELGLAINRENESRILVDRLTGQKVALDAFANKLPKKRAALASLENEFDEVDYVFKVANGQVGMRVNLVNFYLGQRLRQIAALASDRLMKMSDNHFYLEHSESSKEGNKKVGLELNLFDTWTMTRRPVGDFSGGELFMASLALALALSDVVKAESGSSVSLDTLFIDEGFGSLDPTFTDTVVSVLEELRTYGRIVGLVSHVPDIQARIPTQLVIEKTMQGSKVLPISGD